MTNEEICKKIAKVLNSKHFDAPHFAFDKSAVTFNKTLSATRQNQVNYLFKLLYHEWGCISYQQVLKAVVFLAADEARGYSKLNNSWGHEIAKIWMDRSKNLLDFIKHDINKLRKNDV